MKHLKRFNEELSPNTYRRAARKITNDPIRVTALRDWADEVENKGNIQKWKSNIQEFSPFGIFKMNIVSPSGDDNLTTDFALDLTFDADSFSDSYEEGEDGSFSFFGGIIPLNDLDKKRCDDVLAVDDFGNGFYWALWVGVSYIIENGMVIIKNFELSNYDSGFGDISFADRTSANKFKNLMIKIFSDRGLNYPSGYTDADTIFDKLEQTILMENSMSSDYGFKLEDVAEFIKTISPNTLYKRIN